MTKAIVEKLVLEKSKDQHEAFEALVAQLALLLGADGLKREQPPVQTVEEITQLYNQAAHVKSSFDQVKDACLYSSFISLC